MPLVRLPCLCLPLGRYADLSLTSSSNTLLQLQLLVCYAAGSVGTPRDGREG
jgi:hypothetical protein